MKKTIAETQVLNSEKKRSSEEAHQAIAFDHALHLNHAQTRKKSYCRSLCRFILFLSQVSLFMVDYRYVIDMYYKYVMIIGMYSFWCIGVIPSAPKYACHIR